MRLRFQRLKGMEVLAEREGKLLGSVRRIHIDSKKRIAVGIVFKARRLSTDLWTRVQSVTRIGEDVLVLPDSRAVRDDEPPGRDLRDMIGLSVTSLDGKRLGELEDVVFETDDWRVEALVLDSGGEVEPGPQAVFGEDTILLQKGAAERVRQTPGEHHGFLSRMFHTEPEREPAPALVLRPSRKKAKGRSVATKTQAQPLPPINKDEPEPEE